MTANLRREALRLADQSHHYSYGDGADPATGVAFAGEAQARALVYLADTLREVLLPRGKVLVDQCATAETGTGPQCLKHEGHDGDHDFGHSDD